MLTTRAPFLNAGRGRPSTRSDHMLPRDKASHPEYKSVGLRAEHKDYVERELDEHNIEKRSPLWERGQRACPDEWVRLLSEEERHHTITIFDRPRLLRFIGLTQMLFGFFGVVATVGLLYAWSVGVESLKGVGPLYAAALFLGVALPCLVIGNYVDDLRREAVIAQILYSTFAVVISAYFLYWRGIDYHWTFPFFDTQFDVFVGNLAAEILVVEAVFALYLVVKWHDVVPPPGTVVERDRTRARLIQRGVSPSALSPAVVSADGTELTTDQQERVLQVRRVETEEGMAILCSNCGGATPLSKVAPDNTLTCDYCGVRLGVSSVFVPCKNHPGYLAATSCAVCGGYFCRQCLTAQEPPVDERWDGSTIFLCKQCFEGRYRPAVTTASLVIPIEELFTKAGGRFAKLGQMYKRFLYGYASSMRYVAEFGLKVAVPMLKGASGPSGDNAAAALLVIILIIIAIPVLVAVLMLAAGIVIIPLLFYAGLISITIQAIRIIRHTDFVSLAEARDLSIRRRKEVRTTAPPMREATQSWSAASRPSRPPPIGTQHLSNADRRRLRREMDTVWARR